MSGVYISDISWDLGEIKSISECPAENLSEDAVNFFNLMGFDKYCVSHDGLSRLIVNSVTKTIQKSGIGLDDVDLVIVASSSYNQTKNFDISIAESMTELGIDNIPVMGVTLAQCGNFASALRIAKGLLLEDEVKNILLITGDVAASEGERFQNLAFNSDGVASCIISSKPIGMYKLIAFEQVADLKARDLINSETNELSEDSVKRVQAGLGKLREKMQAAHGNIIDDCHQLITNNYSISALRFISEKLNVPSDRIFKSNTEKYGHVYCSDGLINLETYSSENDSTNGKVAILSSGRGIWSLMIVDVDTGK